MPTKPFKLLPLYLRREVTTDYALHDMCRAMKRPIPLKLDVVAYASPADVRAKQPKARWGWHSLAKPTRRNKRVTVNCYQWAVVWLPDLNA